MSIGSNAVALEWPTDSDALAAQWTVIEAGPSIVTKSRIQDANEQVSPYSADAWNLGPLGRITGTTRTKALAFKAVKAGQLGFPEPLQPAFKRIAWLMLNQPTPDELLQELDTTIVEWPSWGTIYARMDQYRSFAWFISDEFGAISLADVTSDLFDEYRAHVKALTIGASSKSKKLQALLHLPPLADRLPAGDRVPDVPWTFSNPAIRQVRSLGNLTEVIPYGTMTTLLAWGRIFVRDLAPDITAAVLEKRRMLEATEPGGPTEKSTREGRERAAKILENLDPVPGLSKGGRTSEGSYGVAARYLAAMNTDVTRVDIQRAAAKQRIQAQSTAPQPIPVAVTGHIEQKPWTDYIDWRDVDALHKALVGACLVVTAALTGMRPHELLNLKPGCVRIKTKNDLSQDIHLLEDFNEDPEAGDWVEIAGHRFKGVREQDGQQSLTGRSRSWAGTRTVASAIGIMEDLIPEGSSPPSLWVNPVTGQPVTSNYAIDAIAGLIDIANEIAADLDLPDGYLFADGDNDDNVTLTRFRRTIAHNFLYRPNGELILGVSYGHSTSTQGAGYASTGTSGFNQLVQEQRKHYLYDSIENLTTQIEAGTGISGPAGERLVQASEKFKGTYSSPKDLDRMAKDPEMQVYVNPTAIGACVFNPDTAACRNSPKAIQNPDLLNCSSTCANLAYTDQDAEQMLGRANELRIEAAASPDPLAARLTKMADDLESRASRHESTKKQLNPEADQE